MEKAEKIRIIKDSYNSLRGKGIIKTQGDFARLLGISEKSLSAAKNGVEGYCTDSLAEKIIAFITEQEKKDSVPTPPVAAADSPKHSDPSQYAPSLVPTIPFKVYNETGVNLQEYIMKNVVPMGPAIAQFATTDLHMFVSNDEMKPHLRSGDVLSLKRVSEEAPIVNGEIYVINSYYLGLTVRFVFDRGTHYELKSSNEWYEPFNLPKEQVFGIYRILGLVRTNI